MHFGDIYQELPLGQLYFRRSEVVCQEEGEDITGPIRAVMDCQFKSSIFWKRAGLFHSRRNLRSEVKRLGLFPGELTHWSEGLDMIAENLENG